MAESMYDDQIAAVIHAQEDMLLGRIADIGQQEKGPDWDETRDLRMVLAALPTYGGKSLYPWLRSADPAVRFVVELGCGRGAVALQELVSSFQPGEIQALGVTLPADDEPQTSWPEGMTVEYGDIDTSLEQLVADGRSPTAIYMNMTAMWLPNQWGTLKNAYDALAVGGVLLVDAVDNANALLIDSSGQLADPRQIQQRLRQAGYGIEIVPRSIPTPDGGSIVTQYSVAMQKTASSPELHLPMGIVTPTMAGREPQEDAQQLALLGDALLGGKYYYQLSAPKV